jgi:hypothetical protein
MFFAKRREPVPGKAALRQAAGVSSLYQGRRIKKSIFEKNVKFSVTIQQKNA